MPRWPEKSKNENVKVKSVKEPEKETVENKVQEPIQETVKVQQPIKATVQASVSTSERVKNKAEQMKDHLDSQPKVSIMIPLEKGENKNASQSFCINGYRFTVPKGRMVQVPEQVAQMVSERFNVDLEIRGQSLEQKDASVKTALDA